MHVTAEMLLKELNLIIFKIKHLVSTGCNALWSCYCFFNTRSCGLHVVSLFSIYDIFLLINIFSRHLLNDGFLMQLRNYNFVMLALC